MNTLTVAILTQNEAKRITNCIKSASFAHQIIVLDSGSTDDTVQIARDLGAQVHIEADWQGFAVQRNRCLTHATGDYIFFLDADEEITPELQAEIVEQVATGQDAIWTVQWLQIAYGKPLSRMRSHNQHKRLFKRSNLKGYEGIVHESVSFNNPNTPTFALSHQLLHYSRDTIYASILKLAQYSQLGAIKRQTQHQSGGLWRGALSGLASFVRLYIFNGGILCGGAGFLHCFFSALEAFFRYAMLTYDSKSITHAAKRNPS